MNNSEYILKPAKLSFIVFSFIIAHTINLIFLDKIIFAPDCIGLLLFFWSIHRPNKIRMSFAFMIGFFVDIHKLSFFGEYSISYVILSYFANMLRSNILWLPIKLQIFYIIPILISIKFISLIIHMLYGDIMPNLIYLFSSSILEALIWPIINFLLFIHQKKALNIK